MGHGFCRQRQKSEFGPTIHPPHKIQNGVRPTECSFSVFCFGLFKLMTRKEFTESVRELLNHGVYYSKKGYESPHQVKQLSDQTIMVEFFNPEDTFLVTMEHRDVASDN